MSWDLYLFNYFSLIESSDEALLIHFRPCDLLCLVSFMKKSFSMGSRRISIWTASCLVGRKGSLPLALILEKILQAEIIDSQLAQRHKYCLHGRTKSRHPKLDIKAQVLSVQPTVCPCRWPALERADTSQRTEAVIHSRNRYGETRTFHCRTKGVNHSYVNQRAAKSSRCLLPSRWSNLRFPHTLVGYEEELKSSSGLNSCCN